MKLFHLCIAALLLVLSTTVTAAPREHKAFTIHWDKSHAAHSQRAYPRLAQRIERDKSTITRKPAAEVQHRSSRYHTSRAAHSVREAAEITRGQYGGKVLKVDRNAQAYRVKVLRDGRVTYVIVPAE